MNGVVPMSAVRVGQECSRKKRIQRLILRMAIGAVAASAAMLAASPWYRLAFNGSESLRGLVYLVIVGAQSQRDELIAFYPVPNRFYRNGMYFVKLARGVGGDVIERRGLDFYVNGTHQATAKTRSLQGLPLLPGPEGSLPDGFFWVWTPHPDSFDSRYADVGWIAPDRVLGRAIRLL